MQVYSKQVKIIELSDFDKEIDGRDYPKYFTVAEISDFGAKKSKGSLAARFVLKQLLIENAFQDLDYLNIEILNDLQGKPNLNIINKEVFPENIQFSISHTKKTASAILVIEPNKFKCINLSTDKNIALLTLSDPPKNEMTLRLFWELSIAIDYLSEKTEINGLVISSEGRHFSSGANVEELLSSFKKDKQSKDASNMKHWTILKKISNLPFPVIACLKGVCLGSALELALSAKYRIATPNAMLAFPESGFGIMPGLGGILNSMRYLSKAKAMEMVLGGGSINAEEALGQGVVNEIVEKNEMVDRAVSIIRNRAKSNNKNGEI